MEHEIMMTGIGGQGIQLAAQILARAAVVEGREVMTLGTYGGSMRGGNTDSTLVVADRPIQSPPIVSKVGTALAMHHAFFAPIEKKLRPGALVVVNSTIFETKVDASDIRPYDVPATQIATDLDSPMAASLALVGAYANLTGLVTLDALIVAMKESVPSYRRQFVETNEKVLAAGFTSVPANLAPAWSKEEPNP